MPARSDTPSVVDRQNMCVALDRLIPPVDDLPGAGSMGLLDDVERMTARHDRYRLALGRFIDALSGTKERFAELAPGQQDEVIKSFETSAASDFANVLEVIYIAYYSRPEVHSRIGWRTGALQPQGFELPPFDESILDSVRQRAPFWRTVSG
jgi:gluconate 2-dehydrogenase subunit 3-like protein